VTEPRVLFVTKPIVEPFNDGTRAIVMALGPALETVSPLVMTVPPAPRVDGVTWVPVYGRPGGYAPGLRNNARAARYLAFGPRAELWHFVFAPNPSSSRMGRVLKRWRRVPVVQTIASRPRSFAEPRGVLFGDVVVAQSESTRQAFLRAFEAASVEPSCRPELRVIPPPLGVLPRPRPEAHQAVRAELGIDEDAPIVLYPGDLEVSRGKDRVASAIPELLANHPRLVVVIAYREKTARARGLAEDLERGLGTKRVRLVRESRDILALVQASQLLLFPVDDLYGKVDIPIILLEAMELGTPILVTDEGPLAELESVARVEPERPDELVKEVLSLLTDQPRRQALVPAQRAEVARRFSAAPIARAYESIYEELLAKRG